MLDGNPDPTDKVAGADRSIEREKRFLYPMRNRAPTGFWSDAELEVMVVIQRPGSTAASFGPWQLDENDCSGLPAAFRGTLANGKSVAVVEPAIFWEDNVGELRLLTLGDLQGAVSTSTPQLARSWACRGLEQLGRACSWFFAEDAGAVSCF